MDALYTDGGMIGAFAGCRGGTWAWLRLADGVPVAAAAGWFPVEEYPAKSFSSTIPETVALCDGINALPAGWQGTVYSDSKNGLLWVFEKETRYLSTSMRLLVEPIRTLNRLRGVRHQLIGGHPTEADCREGIRAARPGKSRLPCSVWNVWCDRRCTELSLRIQHRETPPRRIAPDLPPPDYWPFGKQSRWKGPALAQNRPEANAAPVPGVSARDPEKLAEEERFVAWMEEQRIVPATLYDMENARTRFEEEVLAR